MNLPILLLLGGFVVVAWIYLYSRQRANQLSQTFFQLPKTDNTANMSDAVLVATKQGKLIHANEMAMQWLNLSTGKLSLEQVARLAEPSENLLRLFSADGQSSFQVKNRWVEATSYDLVFEGQDCFVVTMRELSATGTNDPDVLNVSNAMSLINEINETVSANMGVDNAIQTILTLVRGVIHYEGAEICLWDESEKVLHQRGWVGDSRYLLLLQETGGKYAYGEGISGWIAQYRQPVLISSQETAHGLHPKLANLPFKSILAVPINLGDRFFGTFEVMSLNDDAFTPSDQALLQAVSKTVATSIHNAEIYADQARRIESIATLQQTIGGSTPIEQNASVYASLCERVAKLVPADMCAIFLYDPDRKGLVTQLPAYGIPEALIRNVFIPLPENSPQYDIFFYQSNWVSNDAVDEPLIQHLGLDAVVRLAGIHNMAWFPLQLAQQRIGMITVSNKRGGGGFNMQDIQNLTALAAQSSIVVESVRLYQRERRMDTELVGLQEITNAIGALSHESEFYGEITERIAKLMGMQMCGILLYDPEKAQLVSKLPFYGVAGDDIGGYVIPIPDEGVIKDLWTEEAFWYSNRVQTDSLVFVAGLDALAEQLGVKKTLMAVLQASGRRIGVIQISNKLDGTDFSDNDARLLMVFATQAAAIIENSRLFLQARRSAEQAQGLRSIAELAGNVLTSQESFTPVLAEIARVTGSEMVFVNVLDTQKESLITYPRWVYGKELAESIAQNIYSPGFEYSVVSSQRPYIGNDVQNDKRVLPSYRTLAQKLDIQRAILVPLIFADRVLGELGVANRARGDYDTDDYETVRVIAAQVAAALDRLLLYEQTGQNLTRRLEELDAISHVSNELTTTLDNDQILRVIRDEVIKATKADNCTILLLKPRSEWQSLDKPQPLKRIGMEDEMLYLAPIEMEAVLNGTQHVLITDYEFSTMRALPDGVRSGLATPILYLDQVVGVIHVFHRDANRFDDKSAAFLSSMAVKASLGYGNSERYLEQLERSDRLRRRVDQLNRIFELGHFFQSNTDPISILEAIAYSVQQSVGFDVVVMTMIDPDTNILTRVAQAGMPVTAFEDSKRFKVTTTTLSQILKPHYRISESYFFPLEDVEQWHSADMQVFTTKYEGNRTLELGSGRAWRDGDLFLVTMLGPSGNIIGVMSLDRPHDNRRPDRGTVEVLEIFANQAASTIENTRLYLSSVQSAEQEARLNEMMEAVSKSLEIEEIVRSVAMGASRLVAFDRMNIALLNVEDNGFELLNVTANPDKTFTIARESRPTLGNTVLNRTYRERSDYLYLTSQDPEWLVYDDLREWKGYGEQVALVLPLLTGGEALGVLHIGSNSSSPHEFVEYRGLLKRMTQLVASTIQNARLFDQAVNLQVLNESVVESIQQGIVVLDNNARIITTNGFMTDRYAWGMDAKGQDFFAYRPQTAQDLHIEISNVLTEGKPQVKKNQISNRDDGSLLVTNFYIYPLRFGFNVRGAVLLVEDVTEQAKLEQAMESRANQLSALTEVSSRITSSLERDEVVQLALEEMAWLIPYDVMTLWRRNGSYLVLEGSTELPIEESRKRGFRFLFGDFELVQTLVETQRVVVSENPTLPDGIFEYPPASWMGVPLVNQGHVVGMLMLASRLKNAYEGKSDQNIASAFASQVAIALANAELFQQTFDRTAELGTLLEAAQATSQTTDLDAVFRTVVELMFTQMEMDSCSIMTWDEVDNQLEVQFEMRRGEDSSGIQKRGTGYSLDQYTAKMRALRDREVVVITRNDANSPYTREMQDMEADGDSVRMLVPLVVREQSRGLIQLGQFAEGMVTQQKVRLARALGAQVALGIENARLSEETRNHFEESLIINELSRTISSTLDVQDMFTVVRDQLPNVAGASELYIAIKNPDTNEVEFPMAVRNGEPYDIPSRPYANDEVSFIIKNRRPLNLGADYYSPDELRRSLGITNNEGDVRSYLGVPIEAGDEVYGVLAVRDSGRTRAFTLNEQRILQTVGSQLGVAIQNARLFQRVRGFADDLNKQVAERTNELESERDRIDTLYQITSELARTLDMERLMPRALGMVAKAVNAHDGVIMQLDLMTDQLYSRAALNPHSLMESADGGHASHPAERVARWLIEEDEHVQIVENLHETDFWDSDAQGAEEWHSALAVALEANEELLGVMVFLSRDVSAFNESHVRLMVAAANQVASSINNAELYKMIREQAERLGALLRAEQEEADKNKAILEGIADGVVVADIDGKIIEFNVAAERILRVPRSEARGQSLAQLTGVYGATATTWAQAIENRLLNPDFDSSGQYLNERIELGERVVSVHLSPVYTGEKFLGTVSVFRDITREVEAERSKSLFISNVSHEFRTPLTPIKGYLDMLLYGAAGEVPDMQKMWLNTIKDNVVRLTLLVEDVLNISKIDAGREQLALVDLNLNEVMQTAIAELQARPSHQNKNFDITFAPDVTLPVIQADADKITRALSNIVDNAFNYTPRGGTINISIEPTSDNEHVLVTVKDTGVGIPEDFRERVWRRFERHEETAVNMDVAGTGLGLPIVKEIVEMHGGRVWFESEVGVGTTFYISLPIKQPDYLTANSAIARKN
ncbi:MAG: GAF domain-containing protein [Anaerolineae bacterium]|nr:GAF domain-containing protein [Anaerolineae bacterium]